MLIACIKKKKKKKKKEEEEEKKKKKKETEEEEKEEEKEEKFISEQIKHKCQKNAVSRFWLINSNCVIKLKYKTVSSNIHFKKTVYFRQV